MPDDHDHADVLIPAPFAYAGFGLAVWLLDSVLPLPVPYLTMVRGLGAVMVGGGLLLGFLAVFRLMQAHTSVSPHQPSTALVTDGLYGFTRNPIYLGFFLIYLGFTFVAGTAWGLVLCPLIPLVVNHLIIGAEERYLQAKFEREYTEYRSRVRRWI
jgi:protein-S-isoprenylcysteine O-methyltransferase Ste14